MPRSWRRIPFLVGSERSIQARKPYLAIASDFNGYLRAGMSSTHHKYTPLSRSPAQYLRHILDETNSRALQVNVGFMSRRYVEGVALQFTALVQTLFG